MRDPVAGFALEHFPVDLAAGSDAPLADPYDRAPFFVVETLSIRIDEAR
jgi:hypothetical protein